MIITVAIAVSHYLNKLYLLVYRGNLLINEATKWLLTIKILIIILKLGYSNWTEDLYSLLIIEYNKELYFSIL